MSDIKRKAAIFDVKGKSIAATSEETASIQQQVNAAPSSKRFKTSDALERAKPLPERVRPKNLDEVIGQKHLLAKGALLRSLIDKDAVGESCLQKSALSLICLLSLSRCR